MVDSLVLAWLDSLSGALSWSVWLLSALLGTVGTANQILSIVV